jgi:hypothetical protein
MICIALNRFDMDFKQKEAVSKGQPLLFKELKE